MSGLLLFFDRSSDVLQHEIISFVEIKILVHTSHIRLRSMQLERLGDAEEHLISNNPRNFTDHQ